MGARIHASAVVDPRAEIADGVEVGPYAVIGAGVQLGARTRVMAHAVLEGPTVLGTDNVIHPFAVVGGAPQHKRDASQGGSRLVIGDRNVIREHVTLHRGTEGRSTTVGCDNLFMVGAHVAHDVAIGSFVTLSNGVQLAGHASVGDYATFGGLSGVAQFVVVGESAFVAAGAMCEARVPPFVIVQGDRARVRALNVVGLRRRGVSEATIAELARTFRALFGGKRPRAEAAASIDSTDPLVLALVRSLADGARG